MSRRALTIVIGSFTAVILFLAGFGLAYTWQARNMTRICSDMMYPMGDRGMMQQHGMSNEGCQLNMQACHRMMVEKLGMSDESYDLRFLTLMIDHHQGAIEMAQSALVHARHPEIKEMAQKIIDQQSKEIDQLKAWRREWFNR